MKLCDRCRVPGCLLDYGGKACQEARKKYCPDVVFTHADKIREMDDEALAFIINRRRGKHGADRDGAVCGADLLRVCS